MEIYINLIKLKDNNIKCQRNLERYYQILFFQSFSLLNCGKLSNNII